MYKKSSVPFESMARLLKGYDLNAPELAKVLGCSVPTARTKLMSPSKFTLADIGAIARFGHIQMDELRQAIKE